MSEMPIGAGAFVKLIAIRRETLSSLRQDVLRLRQIQNEAESGLAGARGAQDRFLEEVRAAERGDTALFVDQMQDRRRYLAHLDAQVSAAKDAVDAVSLQQQQAQAAFEACHKEVKALERLAERRETAIRQVLQRRDLLRADDEELVRGQRGGEAHDIGY